MDAKGRPIFIPSGQDVYSEYLHMSMFYNEQGVYMCIFEVINADVPDALWSTTMSNMKHFLRWCKTTATRFHFVFDIHKCDQLPASRIYALQEYFKTKHMLANHLHSSVVVTSSTVLELLFRAAFNFTTPQRPMTIVLTERNGGGVKENVQCREIVEAFFKANHL